MKINNKKIKSLFFLSLIGSGLGQEENSKNQTEILNNNQLPEVATNFTDAKVARAASEITSEINPSQNNLFAGYPIIIENQKKCTAAFIGKKQDFDGFITSARCIVNDDCKSSNGNCQSKNIYDNVHGCDDNGSVNRIGRVYDRKFGDNGLDYAFVSLDSVDWKPFLYTTGLVSDDGTVRELYPVTSHLTLTVADKGTKVCAYGAKSGYRCGKLNEVDIEINIPNPWNGNPTTLKVNQVYLEKKGFESEEDIGGPVYAQVDNNGTTTAQALGHITSFDSDGRTGRKYFYYTPIEKVLSTGIIELTTRFPSRDNITNPTEIKYSKWSDTITARATDPKAATYVFAGDAILSEDSDAIRKCTTNFAVKKNGQWAGMLTAGHCDPNGKLSDVYLEKVDNGKKKIGYTSDVVYTSDNDFAFIETWDVEVLPCIAVPKKGWIWDSVDYLAVDSALGSPPPIGEEICAVGATSGKELCGKVLEHNAVLAMSPGNKFSTITGLIKVDTGWNGFTHGDSGGPVYVKLTDEKNGIDGAVQVAGHMVAISRYNGIFVDTNYFYYIPLTKTFGTRNFELITAQVCPIIQKNQLAKKHEAQIEVPLKK